MRGFVDWADPAVPAYFEKARRQVRCSQVTENGRNGARPFVCIFPGRLPLSCAGGLFTSAKHVRVRHTMTHTGAYRGMRGGLLSTPARMNSFLFQAILQT